MKKSTLLIVLISGLFGTLLCGAIDTCHAKDCEKAKAYFEKAMAQEDLNEAIKNLEISSEICPNFNVSYNLGNGYMKLDLYDKALASFEQAFKLGGNARALGAAKGRIAQVKAKQNRLMEAIVDFQAAMKLDSDYPEWIKSELQSIELAQMQNGISTKEIDRGLKAAIDSARNFSTAASINIRVNFNTNSHSLTSASMNQVKALGLALNQDTYKDKSICLVGHADKRGDAHDNLVLSKRRAKTVFQALSSSFPGLSNKLTHTGRGEENLLYDGETDTDHRLNRRVEVKIQ